MSFRTVILLVVAVAAGTVTFIVGRLFGHTLLFVPLFLFWSWGDRRRAVDDGAGREHRLSDTDGVVLDEVEQEHKSHRYPARTHESEAA